MQEHIDLVHDFGMHIGDLTSVTKFQPTVDGFSVDKVGLTFAPGAGTYMDYAVKQWFTVQFQGQNYDLTTEFGHQTNVVNGSVTTKVWDIIP